MELFGEFDSLEIAHTNIKELNQKLKRSPLSLEEREEVKKLRRRIKMRAYRKKSRRGKRDELKALKVEKAELVKLKARLQKEIEFYQRNVGSFNPSCSKSNYLQLENLRNFRSF